jgi:hypothetical protein
LRGEDQTAILVGVFEHQRTIAISPRRPRMAEVRGSSPLGSTPFSLRLQVKIEQEEGTGKESDSL